MSRTKKTFPFPAPQFLPADVAIPLEAGEDAKVRRLNGDYISGQVIDWSPEASFLELVVQEGEKQRKLRLEFSDIKLVVFPRLRMLQSQTEDLSHLVAIADESQSFDFTFTDGTHYQGHTYTFHEDEQGFVLFTEGGADSYSCAFIPRGAASEHRFGRKMSELIEESKSQTLPPTEANSEVEQKRQESKRKLSQYVSESSIRRSEDLIHALAHQARTPNRLLGQILLDEGIINEHQLEKALKEKQHNTREPLGQILIRQRSATPEDIQYSLARKLNIPFVDLGNFEIDFDVVKLVPERLARKHTIIPLCRLDKQLVVATEDPLNATALDAVRFHTNMSVEPVMATKDAINTSLNQLYALASDVDMDDLVLDNPEERDRDRDINADEEELQENLTVRLVNKVITDGINMGASDIHFEPYGPRKKAIIRFRKDGAMQHYYSIPASLRFSFVARLKVMARLDTSITRVPQDGKIAFRRRDDSAVELRVATIPTISGSEDIVIRILPQEKPRPLGDMGMEAARYRVLVDTIEKPYGLFLAVGPTGSGKTTTLHSILNHLNTEDRKIWTAEDPVELTATGLRQIQINNKVGLNFAAVIRSILRADPDIIMVGEIRDKETASIALEASLTGHLVLGTMHTNNAPSTVQRFLQMGMDPFNFGDALLGVLAQRLARTLCSDCATKYEATDHELELLADEYINQHKNAINRDELIKQWTETYGEKGHIKLARKVGCDSCNQTGYRGRTAIHELLTNEPEVQEAIFTDKSQTDLRRIAQSHGMLTLKQSGIVKVLQGLTDIHEIRKVSI